MELQATPWTVENAARSMPSNSLVHQARGYHYYLVCSVPRLQHFLRSRWYLIKQNILYLSKCLKKFFQDYQINLFEEIKVVHDRYIVEKP